MSHEAQVSGKFCSGREGGGGGRSPWWQGRVKIVNACRSVALAATPVTAHGAWRAWRWHAHISQAVQHTRQGRSAGPWGRQTPRGHRGSPGTGPCRTRRPGSAAAAPSGGDHGGAGAPGLARRVRLPLPGRGAHMHSWEHRAPTPAQARPAIARVRGRSPRPSQTRAPRADSWPHRRPKTAPSLAGLPGTRPAGQSRTARVRRAAPVVWAGARGIAGGANAAGQRWSRLAGFAPHRRRRSSGRRICGIQVACACDSSPVLSLPLAPPMPRWSSSLGRDGCGCRARHAVRNVKHAHARTCTQEARAATAATAHSASATSASPGDRRGGMAPASAIAP